MAEDGAVRAAIFMLALGEDEAAEVMKHLGPREVQKIGAVMAKLTSVEHEQVAEALNQFKAATEDKSSFGQDSDEYIRSVLVKALGEDIANGLLNRILQSKDATGIEGLKWMDAQTVADLIRNEHSQIIATILVHLDPAHASDILSYFTERLRLDVMLRISTLDGVKPAALKELNDVLTKLLSGNENLNKKQIGGVRAAAEIMNFMKGDFEAAVMEGIREYDVDMAQEIMDEMFVFDDIVGIDDVGIQTLLREVQSESLIVALKGSTEEMRDKIFKNMSSRAAEMLKEDLESKGPVKLSEVEAQQKAILQTVRKLADAGQIMLSSKGGDDQYV
jgi:flagellar motor switch protein FliG